MKNSMKLRLKCGRRIIHLSDAERKCAVGDGSRSQQQTLEDHHKVRTPVNGLSNKIVELVCAQLRPNALHRATCSMHVKLKS